MPKEITHWLIADAARAMLTGEENEAIRCLLPALELSPTSLRHVIASPLALPMTVADSELRVRLTKACSRYTHLLYLSAILHDAPYYVMGSCRPAALRVADQWHGNSGEDTYDIVRLFLAAMHRSPNDERWYPALLGIITHIAADSIMHPFVYYMSGNFHANPHRAWRKHRQLESAIDMALCAVSGAALQAFSLSDYYAHSAGDLRALLQALPCVYDDEGCGEGNTMLMRGFSTLQRVRLWETRAVVGSLLDLCETYLPQRVQAYTALRYSDIYTLPDASDMNTLQSYRHPATGEYRRESLAAMVRATVLESCRLWLCIEPSLPSSICSEQKPFVERGASLELGLQGVAARKMRYFADNAH